MKARRAGGPTRAPVLVNDRALTAAQEAAFRGASQLEASPRADERARAAARFKALEDQLAHARTEEAVRTGISDSLALARGRGETVETIGRSEARVRVRITSRDGLETLTKSGAINPVQFRAGMLYRALYEAVDPERDLRSQLTAPAFLGAPGSGGGAPQAEGWAERRLRLSRRISQIETKVRIADRNGRAVQALREVAGHARCLSHVASGGGAQAAYRRALVVALDVIADHLGLQQERAL